VSIVMAPPVPGANFRHLSRRNAQRVVTCFIPAKSSYTNSDQSGKLVRTR
jgi:hypothetical protein